VAFPLDAVAPVIVGGHLFSVGSEARTERERDADWRERGADWRERGADWRERGADWRE
jgi:hypothetical protein